METKISKRTPFENEPNLTLGKEKLYGGNSVQLIPLDKIKSYHDYPFRLYEGRQLNDMAKSIRENGIQIPVIVNEINGIYEMLSGHNLQNVARLAGLKTIPSIVKSKLSEDEAYVYIVETNLIQRSFAGLLPSEKAIVLSDHYQKICKRVKKNMILRELGGIFNVTPAFEGNNNRVRTRGIVAEEYGFSSRNAARYLRLNNLIQPFKDMVDNKSLVLLAGVDMSYLMMDEQELVWTLANKRGWSIKPKIAGILRRKKGSLDEQTITEVFEKYDRNSRNWAFKVKISTEMKEKYFSGMDAEQVSVLIERALMALSTNETKNCNPVI